MSSMKMEENKILTPYNIEKKYPRIFSASSDDDIVISGMAGRFPNCHNVAEFEYNLYNKVMIGTLFLLTKIKMKYE